MTYPESSQFALGVDLLNRGMFYDAHEVLEDAWRAAPEPERRFLQGLMQVAVASIITRGKAGSVFDP